MYCEVLKRHSKVSIKNNNDYLLAVLSSIVYIVGAGDRAAGGYHGTSPGPGPEIPAGR